MLVDIVVRIVGGNDGEAEDWVSRGLNFDRYYSKSNRRLWLLGIGKNGWSTRADCADLANKTVNRIKEQVKPGEDRGILCLHGNSAGGRAALEVAVKLTAAGIPITFLGIEDAAFFPYETDSRPNFTPKGIPASGIPYNTPEFDVKTISADKKVNYYQTGGNWMELTSNKRDAFEWWCSSMLGKEIHGKISGWSDQENIDLKSEIATLMTDREKHDKADEIALSRNRAAINSILDNLPSSQDSQRTPPVWKE